MTQAQVIGYILLGLRHSWNSLSQQWCPDQCSIPNSSFSRAHLDPASFWAGSPSCSQFCEPVISFGWNLSAWTAITKCYKLHGLILFSCSSRGWEIQDQGSVRVWFSISTFFLFCRWFLWLHMVFSSSHGLFLCTRERASLLSGVSSCKDTNLFFFF